MTHEERRNLINRLRVLPLDLEETVSGLSDEQLDTPYGDGKWTIRELVHHLAESHMNGFARFKWLLTEDNTTLKVYDQEDWVDLPDSRMPLESSLAILRGLHQRWAYLLELVDESLWTKTAHHPEDGEYTLEQLLEAYAGHGEKHLGHIEGLFEAKGW